MERLEHLRGYGRFCADAGVGIFTGLQLKDGASLFAWRSGDSLVLALRPGTDGSARAAALMAAALRRRWRDPFGFAGVHVAADRRGVPYALCPLGPGDFEPATLPAAVGLMRRLLGWEGP